MSNEVCAGQEIEREIDREVALHIGIGHQFARTSKWISTLSGFSERGVRESIERLRKNGWPICNEMDGTGYYIADSMDDVERQYNRDYARAMSLLARLRPMRRALREAGRIKGPKKAKKRRRK